MIISVIEKILSSNKFYTEKYIKDTINLTKSIILVNDKEAKLYNNLINHKYPTHKIDYSDKKTWRYYKHLSAQYHALDVPIEITSVDNGDRIVLNLANILFHKLTHKELLKFDLYYKEIVDRYPEQELLIKSIIATSTKYTIQEIIDLEDFSITGYNARLIEENEDDIMFHLQIKINNYKNTKLIQYYSIIDNLFIASQYHILYMFIVTTLIAIRLENAKTLRAHSYHILNYLASHHYLDIHYENLTKKQSLFLYRNLLYLDNHSGIESVYQTLIDKLFTDRNITVVNYKNSQSNTKNVDSSMKYKFKQRLLNNANFVYSLKDFSLSEVLEKEKNLAPSNEAEIKYNYDEIDDNFKNLLFSKILTKDIETIVVDNTDSVKYKLIPTLIDYWAYLLKTNKIKFLVNLVDPVSNREFKLNTSDLFKLFVIILYKLNGINLTIFPTYGIERVYKPVLPTKQDLLKYFYRKHYYYSNLIDDILHSVPSYTPCVTSFQFEQFVTSIYRLNIGLWLLDTNLSDKNDEGQISNLISNLHFTDTYTFNDELPVDFLNRIGLSELVNYNKDSLNNLSYSILNNLYDNKLSFINRYKYIQKSLIEVFKKFNSYTIQIIENYSYQSPILAGPKDTRYSIYRDKQAYEHFLHNLLNIEPKYFINDKEVVNFNFEVNHKSFSNSVYKIDFSNNNKFTSSTKKHIFIMFDSIFINNLNNNWLINESSEEDALFLALNNQ